MRVLALAGVGSALMLALGSQRALAGLGAAKECGDYTCQEHQYCNKYDHQCHPCQVVCDPTTQNYQSTTCVQECQDYIHDTKYVTKNESGASSYDQETRSKLVRSLESYIDTLSITVILALVMTSLMFLTMVGVIGAYIYKTRKKSSNSKSIERGEMALFAQKMQTSDGVLGNNNFSGASISTTSLSVPKLPMQRHHQQQALPEAVTPLSTSVPASQQHQHQQHEESRESTGTAPGTPATCVTTLTTPLGSMRRQHQHHQHQHHHFRREPSESTTPEYAYDNPALAPSPTASDNHNANDSFEEKTNRRQTEL